MTTSSLTSRKQREMRVPAMAGADQRYQMVQVDPRDPDITEEAFQQTAILTLERPKLMLRRRGRHRPDRRQPQEHWTEEMLWECGTREPGMDTMAQCTDAALNDGGGWAKILYTRDPVDLRYRLKSPEADSSYDAYQRYDKATEEAKKGAGPPFAWLYVDPRSIYPVFSGGRLTEVLEITEMPLRSTLRKYRLALDADGNIVPEELGRPRPRTTPRHCRPASGMFEHWDETYCSWMVGGTNYHGNPTQAIVKQFKHSYPFGVPYDYAPGLWMSYWRNRKVGWGISQTKLWLVKYRQYLRAMHAQYVARDLLSPLVNEGDGQAAPVIGNDGKPRERDPGPLPGEILNLPPGRSCADRVRRCHHAGETHGPDRPAIAELKPRGDHAGRHGGRRVRHLPGAELLQDPGRPGVQRPGQHAEGPDREAVGSGALQGQGAHLRRLLARG